MPNLKKLNSQGMAHFLLPLAAVVVVAAVGTYFLVSSSAATKKETSIRSASIKVIGKVDGKQKGPDWCGNATVRFRVKTAGSVDEVYIKLETQAGSAGVVERLTHTGKNNWTATGTKEVCTSKQKGRAEVPGAWSRYEAHAAYGDKDVKKAIKNRTVRVR